MQLEEGNHPEGLGGARNPDKKLAGHLPLSDRPFAFLVTPKLPLGGRRCKSDGVKRTGVAGFVNKSSQKLSTFLVNK
jgi:hypothetical protein